MVRRKSGAYNETEEPESRTATTQDIAALLRQVPTHLFVQMVAKCNLPREDARDLCQAFHRLKK